MVEPDSKMDRRKFLKLAGGAGAALTGKEILENDFPKRPPGNGFWGAGIAGDINEMKEREAGVEEPIEWAIRQGDHQRSRMRPGYLNTTSLFDMDSLDVEVVKGVDTYDVDIDVDLKFVRGDYEDVVQQVHEDPGFHDAVEVRNLQGNLVRDDIFAYHSDFDHDGGNFWTSEKTGVTVADSPESLEEFIGDAPAEFMATFAYAVIEEGEVGKGHPYWNHGSAGIETIDTDYWAEQYEGLDPGKYNVNFNVKAGERGAGEETFSFDYTGDIEDVTYQFRSNTTRFIDEVKDTVDDYL